MKSKKEIIKDKLRTFGLTNLSVDNATSVFLLTMMILLFGIISYKTMPKEQFPEAIFPTIFVNTPYPGNSAADIENLVTRPIEKELNGINGVKYISSNSVQDFSVIIVEFETGIKIEDGKRKVKDAIDLAKSELPNDLPTDPLVQDVNLSEIPIMSVNVSGEFKDPNALKKYAEFLQDELEEINEINKIDLKGALEREIKIDVDLVKMEATKISFADIENAIRSENMNMSGGEILSNEFRRAIRVIGEFESADEIASMIVKAEEQKPVYLRDIAKVSFGFKDRTSIARSNKKPVISLDVIKRKGYNLLDAADQIKETIERVKPQLPENISISIFNDQSLVTREQVNSLENSIISGVILVVLVLLFFLGLRNASFVGLAIPLSMLMGILILNVMGVTLNIIVLFSLILALGMLVDNGIVAVENIYRYKQEGYSNFEAAKFGAGEVALPIIASTATTLAAFIPLAFWPGIMGEFFQYLPITLIIVLSSSLFVALVINPVFTYWFMKIDQRADDKSHSRRKIRNILLVSLVLLIIAAVAHFGGVDWARNLLVIIALVTLVNYFLLRPGSFFFQERILPLLEKIYDKFVRGALYKAVPLGVFFGMFALLIGSIAIFGKFMPKTEFFPTSDPVYLNAFIELPMGKDIEATDKVLKEIEDIASDVLSPYKGIIEEILVQIGENTSDPNSPPEPGTTPNKARLTVSFVSWDKRGGLSTTTALNDLREGLKDFVGVQVVVDKNADGPPVGKPINMEIRGEKIEELAELSDRIIKHFNSLNIEGIEELQADVKIGKPELLINVNREAARRYEVSTFAIADAIRTAVYGKEVSKFKQGEDEYDIFVRLDEKYRYNINDLMNQKITFRNPANGRIVQVPISSIADVKYSSTYSSIKRKNLDRMITVWSNVVEGGNANEIVAELKESMEDFDLPRGFTYEFTGEQQQQAEDLGFLLMAFGVAVFIIFIILVSQFNSITSPFIIILSIVFSLIGVLLGYVITQSTFSIIFTGIGIISLAGIVVNNAIVLIDYINLLIKQKREEKNYDSILALSKEEIKECIINAGSTRLRPVLLTAITTVLGLIPLAMGININFFTFISELDAQISIGGDIAALWGPMAWTVIYGLVFATFLTLVVVPVMYWLAYRLVRVVNRKKVKMYDFEKAEVM